MSSTQQRSAALPSQSRPRPMSADFAHFAPKQSSMLYSMLPSAVQSRLRRLTSLRKSVSMYGTATRSRHRNGTRSGPTTPASRYASAMVLCDDRAVLSVGTEMTHYFEEHAESSEDDRPLASRSRQRSVEMSETGSGITWKFASQGLNLLGLAVEESSQISQDSTYGNAAFARQLYLHALAYLLRALPADLTTEESISIRGALPKGIVEPLRVELSKGQLQSSSVPSKGPGDNPSLLHRTLANTIVQLFILFQFLLPYIKVLLSAAYQYERTNRISERVLNGSIDTIDTLWKRGLSLTSAIYGMGDGKIGQVLTDTVAWIIEGITGGIHDGIGEGMAIIGAKRKGYESGVEKRTQY